MSKLFARFFLGGGTSPETDINRLSQCCRKLGRLGEKVEHTFHFHRKRGGEKKECEIHDSIIFNCSKKWVFLIHNVVLVPPERLELLPKPLHQVRRLNEDRNVTPNGLENKVKI